MGPRRRDGRPRGYLYRTAMNLFRKRYRRTMLSGPPDRRARAIERRVLRRRRPAGRPPRPRHAPAAATRGARADRDARVHVQGGGGRARGHGRDDPLVDAPRARCVPHGDGGRRCLGSRTPSNARAGTVDLEQGDFERLLGRRERKQRNRRIRAGALGVIVALVMGIVLARSLTSDPIPAVILGLQRPRRPLRHLLGASAGGSPSNIRGGVQAVAPDGPGQTVLLDDGSTCGGPRRVAGRVSASRDDRG